MVIKMESIQTYKDLRREINVLESRITDLEQEKRHLIRLMGVNAPKRMGAIDYSQKKVTNSIYVPSLEKLVSRLQEIDKELEYVKGQLESKGQTKAKIEKTIKEFEGLDYKVAYMRVQGKSLIEIADELDYSYGYIRKISMGLRKEHFSNTKVENL